MMTVKSIASSGSIVRLQRLISGSVQCALPNARRPTLQLRTKTSTLIAPNELHGILNDSKAGKDGVAAPRLIDATYWLPNSPYALPDDTPPEGVESLPGAVRWHPDDDSDAEFSTAPHNLPTIQRFAARMALLGVSPTIPVVVYDQHGIFSSPRLWYTLQAFGHRDVRVLDGGLPAWRSGGYETVAAPAQVTAPPPSDGVAPETFEWKFDPTVQLDKVQMLEHVHHNKSAQVLDARSAGRFWGTEPEPREGLRSGHMPGSMNLPFSALLQTNDIGVTSMKPPRELKAVFEEIDGLSLSYSGGGDLIIATCGSGLSACIILLALRQVGATNPFAVYDGSWTEWGACPNTPIE